MSDKIYRVVEIVGTSPESFEKAVENGLGRAAKTLRNLDWFEVKETRGVIGPDGKPAHYQIVLKVGFAIE